MGEIKYAKFRDQVRAVRNASGLTQEDFAREIDVALPTLAKWEQGKTMPAGRNFEKLTKCDWWVAEPMETYGGEGETMAGGGGPGKEGSPEEIVRMIHEVFKVDLTTMDLMRALVWLEDEKKKKQPSGKAASSVGGH